MSKTHRRFVSGRAAWCWITKAIIRLAGRRSHPLSKRLTVRGTRYEWVKKAEVNSGKRAGVPTELADRLKALERKNRELRQANEDPAQGVGIFYPRRARLPVQAVSYTHLTLPTKA